MQNKKSLLPASHCTCCGKSLANIGGKRLTAQTVRGYTLLHTPRVGSKNDPDYRNIEINEKDTDLPSYLCIWGEIWHPEAIQNAIGSIKDGYIPWYCQACGKRLCSACAYPVNRPMGSDFLNDDGSDSHCGILPFNSGCSNPKCTAYKEM